MMSVKDVTKHYPQGRRIVRALNGVSLEIRPGDALRRGKQVGERAGRAWQRFPQGLHHPPQHGSRLLQATHKF